VTLLESLLASVVRADGDALVMHVGDKPFVVSPSGTVELSSRPMNLQAMLGMGRQLLTEEHQRALEQDGAVEHELPSPTGDEDRFVLVAARGGDDVWIEIRRYRSQTVGAVHEQGVLAGLEESEASQLSGPDEEGAPSWPAALDPQPGIVVPMSRAASRPEATASAGPPRPVGLDRLLRLAVARNASTLYIVADSRPMLRIDGDILLLEGEKPIEAAEVETLILDLAPEPTRDALRSGVATEWISDVPEVGQVRCVSFREHRGPGGIFHLLPARSLSADQLGLSREIQALAAHPDGLILVTGRRSSGKSTLISAFVDLINRTRSDHVVTLETQIKHVHEARRAFVSQREVRGGSEEMASAVRAALREDPDVLVIEDLSAAEVAELALDAAESGRLVIGALTAPSASMAVETLVDQFPPDRRPMIQHALSRVLRGAVAQVLLRKAGGGRLAARELLLNTPPVANLIAEGKTFQLPLALESGRKHGMVPLNDALAAFVQSGATDAREAYRKAFDRDGLLNQLKRAGIDTSFVERLA
jgi:twitching motility protein PilT